MIPPGMSANLTVASIIMENNYNSRPYQLEVSSSAVWLTIHHYLFIKDSKLKNDFRR
jgi:hypothetical protein